MLCGDAAKADTRWELDKILDADYYIIVNHTLRRESTEQDINCRRVVVVIVVVVTVFVARVFFCVLFVVCDKKFPQPTRDSTSRVYSQIK